MPTILRVDGYQFMIFTADHPPPHVHIRRNGKLAKVLLDSIEFERTGGFTVGEQNKAIELIREYYDFLLAEWNALYPPED